MEGTEQVVEELKGSVATLTRAVEDFQKDKLDRSTIESIAAEVISKQREANETLVRKSGFQPNDDLVEREEDGLPALKVRGKEFSTNQKLDRMHQMSTRKAANWSGRSEGDVAHFHEVSDNLVLIGAVLGNAADAERRHFDVRETQYFQEEYLPAVRAVSASGAATGAEFVPTLFSDSLITRINLQLRVAALFSTLAMPSNPYKLPAKSVSRQRTGTHAEQTADTGQTKTHVATPGTRNLTLTAVKLAARMLVSKEAEEDSIIPVLGWMQDELVDYLSADIEDALINGDTAGAQDTQAAFYAADDPRKAWDGLRKLTQAGQKTDGANAALTVAMLRNNRKNMGKYGITPQQLAHVLSIGEYISLLSDPAVFTLEKYGPQATILTGELGSVDSVPLIISEYVYSTLNATGIVDGVTTNRTEALTVNRKSFVIGERRALNVEIGRELYMESDQDLLQATLRKAFAPLYPVATEPVVALTYNVQK